MKAWFNRCLAFFKKKPSKPVFYFVHVPKTAGTSFIVLLDRFFSTDQIFPQQLWREVKHIDVKQNARYDLYRGHLGGGGLKVLTDRPIEYLSILRNPHELALSTYEFVLRESNTKVHQLVKDQKLDFAQFISNETTQPLIKNRMVRNISFDFKQDPAAQEVFLSSETIEYLQSIMQHSDSSVTEEQRLERAKRFVDNSRWFGLLERFDESMQLLCYTMCWPPIGPSQKLNANQHKAEISADIIQQLSAINQQDLQLYEYGQNVFQQRWQAMLEDLQVNQMKPKPSIDEQIDQRYQAMHQNELSHFIKYDFAQILLGSQWHRRELMQPEQEYFRWTGPGAMAHIDFWLVQQAYEVTVRIINAIDESVLDDLEVRINDKTCDISSDDKGVVRTLKINCPQSYVQANGLVRLTFVCKKVESHQSAFNSDDQRLVGIAVHWIQFNHV